MTSSSAIQQLRQWVKHDSHPLARGLFSTIKALRAWDFPAPKLVYAPLCWIFESTVSAVAHLLRVLVWTPMFKSKLARVGKGLYLYDGFPCTAGPLSIVIGDHCRVSGQTTITGRTTGPVSPQLIMGNNVGLSWMTTLAVGRRIVLGDNVRIAGRCFLAGYPGHPLDAHDRAQGLPETDDQVGDIILENDVWLGSGVSVMAGVTIGEGTVVGAGSIVTRSLPAHVLAAGNPARVIRSLDSNTQRGEQHHAS